MGCGASLAHAPQVGLERRQVFDLPVGFKYSATGVGLDLCGGLIFVDQASEDLVLDDPVGGRRDHGRVVVRGTQVERAVGPASVVMLYVFLEYGA